MRIIRAVEMGMLMERTDSMPYGRYWDRARTPRFSRRQACRNLLAGGSGLAAAALLACSNKGNRATQQSGGQSQSQQATGQQWGQGSQQRGEARPAPWLRTAADPGEGRPVRTAASSSTSPGVDVRV